jgi:hypothetical protein
MPRVTIGGRHPQFTRAADNRRVTTNPDTDTTAPAHRPDPRIVLESLVSELEYLMVDAPFGAASELIRLHGALLAYNLEGRAELLPHPAFRLATRALRERRVVRAAQRIIERGAGDLSATVELAADEIARLVHLIDPELATRAA